MPEYTLTRDQSDAMLDDDAVEANDPSFTDTSDLRSDDEELCGADLSRGGTCERPAGECPYHD